jgi:hypothetical protein
VRVTHLFAADTNRAHSKDLELPAWRLTVTVERFSIGPSNPGPERPNEKVSAGFMPDTRVYFSNGGAQLAKEGESPREQPGLRDDQISKPSEATEEPQYIAASPNGARLNIPKELFVALSDFIKTRKCPGSITIQFRQGEIVCVEAVAKKTYRNT